MTDESPVTNRVELRVYGLQRSGNHALIQWLIDQHADGPVCHLNDVSHGDRDPFTTAHSRRLYRLPDPDDLEVLRRTPKELLVYSYEDSRPKLKEGQRLLLDSMDDPGFAEHRVRYLGRSADRVDAVVVRDPFNFFASRLRILDKLSGFSDIDLLIENWKSIARAALDGPPHLLPLKFNTWRSDESYRRDLSRAVHGRFSDRTLNRVADFGGGSSFDGLRHAPLTFAELRRTWTLRTLLSRQTFRTLPRTIRRLWAKGAQEMDVFGRWKNMTDDPRFRRICSDPELVDLSEALFGPIQGTREFARSCRSTA